MIVFFAVLGKIHLKSRIFAEFLAHSNNGLGESPLVILGHGVAEYQMKLFGLKLHQPLCEIYHSTIVPWYSSNIVVNILRTVER